MRRTDVLVILLILVAYGLSCKSNIYTEGERIYKAYCSTCHMDDGSGLGSLIPPLTDTTYLRDHKSELVCFILHGKQGKIVVGGTTYDEVMPPVKLTDIQLLNLINYITNAWGNDMKYTTIDEIVAWKNNCRE